MWDGGNAPAFPAGATHYWPANALGTSPDLIGGVDLVAGAGVTLESGPLDNALGVNNAATGWRATTAAIPTLFAENGSTISWWFKASSDPDGWAPLSQKGSRVAFDFEPDFGGDSNLRHSSDGVTELMNLGALSQVSDGSWHHYAATRATDNSTIRFYIDGIVIIAAVPTIGSISTDCVFNVGQPESNPATPMSVSDIATWSRPLTDAEIIALYNGGVPLRPL